MPYVNTTSAWVHRCAKRMLELDPALDPLAAMHTVDDMATSSRWRLMLPEAVAEALYADDPRTGTPSFAHRDEADRYRSPALDSTPKLLTKCYRESPPSCV